MGIIFKKFFQRTICFDFSNGGRPEKRCETKRLFRCDKEVPAIECLLHIGVLEIRRWLDGWVSKRKRSGHTICTFNLRSCPSGLYYYTLQCGYSNIVMKLNQAGSCHCDSRSALAKHIFHFWSWACQKLTGCKMTGSISMRSNGDLYRLVDM